MRINHTVPLLRKELSTVVKEGEHYASRKVDLSYCLRQAMVSDIHWNICRSGRPYVNIPIQCFPLDVVTHYDTDLVKINKFDLSVLPIHILPYKGRFTLI